AQATAMNGEITDALHCCRDAIASAARYRYMSSLAVALQYGAVALSRAGDPATAAALLDCLRAHRHRVFHTTQTNVAEALERGGSVDGRPTSRLTVLDAADLSLIAIDAALGLGTKD